MSFLNSDEAKNGKFEGLLDANHYEIPRVVKEKLEENKKGKYPSSYFPLFFLKQLWANFLL
jgi:hypothetical protein